MAINPRDPRSPAQQIADELREQIESGELEPGARLPATSALVQQYGVATETVRRARSQLLAAGLIVTRQGAGAFVRSQRRLRWRLTSYEHPDTLASVVAGDAWENDILTQGHSTWTDLQVSTLPAPKEIAKRLQIAPQVDLCVLRARVRWIDDAPGILSDDWFPEPIVRGTELAEPESTEREDVLKQAGYEQVTDVDEIVSRMPTAEERERLQLTATEPVAELVRTAFTPWDQPVRVAVNIVPGSALVMQYTIPT